MNIRVFILLIAAVLFASAWNSDARYQHGRIAATGNDTDETVVVTAQQSASAPMLAIPAELPAGEYLVVLANGRSLQLKYPGRSDAVSPTESPRNFYSSAAGGQRAFFIRAETDVAVTAIDTQKKIAAPEWMDSLQSWGSEVIAAKQHDFRRIQWLGRRTLLLNGRRAAALWRNGASVPRIAATLMLGGPIRPALQNAAEPAATQLR